MTKIFKKYEVDSTIVDLNTKLTGIDVGSLSSLKGNLDGALSTLSSSLQRVTTQLEVKETWDDEISATVNDTTVSDISNIINACKDPAFSVLDAVGPIAQTLADNAKNYVDETTNYNDTLYPDWKAVYDDKPSNNFTDDSPNTKNPKKGYQKYIEAMTAWSNDLKPKETACDASLTSIGEYSDAVTSDKATLEGLLVSVGEGSKAALAGLNASPPKTRPADIPEDAEETENEDGTVTYTYTQGGIKYEKTYNGEQIVKEVKTEEDGDTTTTTYKYAPNGKPQGATVETVNTDPHTGRRTTTTVDLNDSGKVLSRVEKVEDFEADGTTPKSTKVTSYDGDNNVTSETVTNYSTENGVRTSHETTRTFDADHPDGVVTTETDNQYYSSGELKKSTTTTYGDDGTTPKSSETVSYEADGKTPTKKETTTYAPNGERDGVTTTTYSTKDGVRTEIEGHVTYNPDNPSERGVTTSISERNYDAESNKLQSQTTTNYDADSKPTSSETTTYQADGETPATREEVTYREGSDIPLRTEETTFREDGSKSSVKVTDTTNNTESFTEIDEYGNTTTTRKGILSGASVGGEEHGVDEEARLAALNRALEDGNIDSKEQEGLGLSEHSPEALMDAAAEQARTLNAKLNGTGRETGDTGSQGTETPVGQGDGDTETQDAETPAGQRDGDVES